MSQIKISPTEHRIELPLGKNEAQPRAAQSPATNGAGTKNNNANKISLLQSTSHSVWSKWKRSSREQQRNPPPMHQVDLCEKFLKIPTNFSQHIIQPSGRANLGPLLRIQAAQQTAMRSWPPALCAFGRRSRSWRLTSSRWKQSGRKKKQMMSMASFKWMCNFPQ